MHHHGQDCMRLKVDVVGHKTHQEKPKNEKKEKEVDEGKGKFVVSGGIHNPANRLSAGENSPEALRSLVATCPAGAGLGASATQE